MNLVDTNLLRAELARLYADLSKHSSYQSIPSFVAEAIDYQVDINEDWRGDRVRLEYILSRLSAQGGAWCDFGANTGFFSLSLAHANPQRQMLAIEANPNHANFIQRIGEAFELSNLQVLGRPIAIDDLSQLPRSDVLLHLNVLHHAGADFDRGRVLGTADFLEYAQAYLQRLQHCTNTLVFQVGTNLWGDKSRPIIDYRADAPKLKLLSDLLLASGWHINETAYPMRESDGRIHYEAIPGINRQSDIDSNFSPDLSKFNLTSHIGEFYRRPLFICTAEDGASSKIQSLTEDA